MSLLGALLVGTLTLNGMAPIYVPMQNGPHHRVKATLSLPPVRGNKQWYANWVMLVSDAPHAKHQVFVQIGLIRRPALGNDLRIFVAWQGQRDPRIGYEEVGVIDEGRHTVSLVQDGAHFTAFVEGQRIAQVTNVFYTSARSRIYAEIGPEVYAEGDRLAGTVSIPSAATCRFSNHGVTLVPAAGAWSAHGRFDRHLNSFFLGDCSAF